MEENINIKKELQDNNLSNSSIEKIPALCAELLTIYNEIKKSNC